MPTDSSPGAIATVNRSMAPNFFSAVTATSDKTSIGIAPTAILKASAPARLITSSTPLADSASGCLSDSSSGPSLADRRRPNK